MDIQQRQREVFSVAKQIEQRITLLAKGRDLLEDKAKAKAKAISDYEKMMAIVLIKLKNGESIGVEDQVIEKPPTTIMKEVAKGICWREKLQMEQAEAEYKCVVAKMNSIQAELNGFQSIYRHLDLT